MITINIDKAKAITHDARRAARSAEFEPFDTIIMKQIPGSDATSAEESRATIRAKYNDIQLSIDSASDAVSLKAIIEQLT